MVIALRLAGRRELAQINSFDLVVLLTLSNTVQNAIIGNDNSVTGGIIGASTLLLINYSVVRFLYGRPKLTKIMEGDEDILVDNGKIYYDRLKTEIITLPELEAAAHKQGFDSLNEIEKAILEPSGTISFVAKKETLDTMRHQGILNRLARIETMLEKLGPNNRQA